MSDTHEDDAAMMRLAGGDLSALNELIGRWKARVASFLFRYTCDSSMALELTEETFIRVYQQRMKYRPVGRFSSWFFQIAANLARQRARWKQRHPEVSYEELQERGSILRADRASLDPAAEADRKERTSAVRDAIMKLPRDQRSAIILQEYEGLSVREIAAIESCTEKAIENRLGRGRKKLKELLSRFLN